MADTIAKTTGRGLVLAGALAATVAFTAVPQPAHALGTGAAIGLSLGAFALGSSVGAAPSLDRAVLQAFGGRAAG